MPLELRLKPLMPKIRAAVKKAIFDTNMSPRGRKLLQRKLRVTTGKQYVRISFTDPVVRYLLLGRKKGPMKWLRKAKRPIPIETKQGVIFRWPTARSFANGRWVHPGKPSYDLSAQLQKHVKPILKDELQKVLAEKFRKAIKK